MTVSRVPNVEGGIQPTIVTAKGDLITAVANANPARLGVGSDGQLLTADSSTATGLSYQNNFAAGKNKIINGDFYVNQRAFTTTTSSGTYGFDRWVMNCSLSDGTTTYSAQTFTTGAAPVAGYEAANFARVATTGQTTTAAFSILNQYIENVRTLAGQTATISFWAKANSGTPKVAIEIAQSFGSGGSPSAGVTTYVSQVTLSTSWTRYSVNVNVPSISGKTIGTTPNTSSLRVLLWVSAGSDFNSRTGSLGIQTNTFDIWGVQVEQGSTATAFQTATGTIQGELAACQRYYLRIKGTGANYPFSMAQNYTTSTGGALVPFPVVMRTRPTALETSGSGGDYQVYTASGTAQGLASAPTFAGVATTEQTGAVNYTTTLTNLVAGNANQLTAQTSSGFLGWSAEL